MSKIKISHIQKQLKKCFSSNFFTCGINFRNRTITEYLTLGKNLNLIK